MKRREQIKRIRESEWGADRLNAALDKCPGTKWDTLYETVVRWTQSIPENQPPNLPTHFEELFAIIGRTFGQAARRGDSQMFRDFADTIDAWKQHNRTKPNPDKLRAALIEISTPIGMGISISQSRVFRVAEIFDHLKKKGFNMDGNANQRQVYRLIDELKIKTDKKPGRPRALTRTP